MNKHAVMIKANENENAVMMKAKEVVQSLCPNTKVEVEFYQGFGHPVEFLCPNIDQLPRLLSERYPQRNGSENARIGKMKLTLRHNPVAQGYIVTEELFDVVCKPVLVELGD